MFTTQITKSSHENCKVLGIGLYEHPVYKGIFAAKVWLEVPDIKQPIECYVWHGDECWFPHILDLVTGLGYEPTQEAAYKLFSPESGVEWQTASVRFVGHGNHSSIIFS